MARAIVLLKLTREGAMKIEQARAIYEETKIFFAQTNYKIIDLYATVGAYDFVSIIEAPDQNALVSPPQSRERAHKREKRDYAFQ